MEEKDKEVMYLISYYLYDGNQIPYKFYGTRGSEIESHTSEEIIKFELNPIYRKYGAPEFSSITYSLYITKSS